MNARVLFSISIVFLCATPVAAQVTTVEGEIGPGALYALFVPDDWNGDLVLYAHGFIDTEAPVALPTADGIEPLRDAILEEGYAVAYSSYSENGLSVKDGAQRTQQLRGIFRSEFGRPDRTYLMGHSLGGLVAIKLAEKHPNHYDGVLAMCGMVGGSQAEVDYVANLRILFDHFYPDVLPGDVLDVPEGLDLTNDVIIPIVTAISTDATGAVLIASIDQTPVPFATPSELVESFVRGLGFNVRGFDDVLGRTHGHSPVDNADTTYTGAVPEPVLDGVNDGVDRFDATPDAKNYLKHNYQPDGSLKIPVLTLHNTRDPVIPLFHESLYAALVAEAGNEDLLVQRTVDVYGHCAFETEEMLDSFLDLVDWVENETAPTP